MRKKFNRNQWLQSDPSGNGADLISGPTANYAHYLLGISSPERLREDAAELPPPQEKPVAVEMPRLPDSMFPNLPDFFQKVVASSSSQEERDILLLGALVR